nr:hypothetical protein Itr_chr02CG12220 [Ipomoea trifida]GLL19718.1 hypothetical protein Itr_chr02CG12230 [Ipomoea trifida]
MSGHARVQQQSYVSSPLSSNLGDLRRCAMGREPSPATAANEARLLLLGEIVTGGELTPAAAHNDGT